MKSITIKLDTLVKIGLVMALIEMAADIGKASMFKSIRVINPETADAEMEVLDSAINSGRYTGLKKKKLKFIRFMCKALND